MSNAEQSNDSTIAALNQQLAAARDAALEEATPGWGTASTDKQIRAEAH